MSSASVTLIVDDQDRDRILYHCPVTKETSLVRSAERLVQSLYLTEPRREYGSPIPRRTAIILLKSTTDPSYPSRAPDTLSLPFSRTERQELFPAFDYLTVTAGSTTQLLGRTVIVDDAEIIQYSGQWSTQLLTPLELSRTRRIGLQPWAIPSPCKFTGTEVLASFPYFLTACLGDSVSVFGVVGNNTDPANSTVSYNVDGVSTVVPVPSTPVQVDVMTEFFHTDLAAGTHTLIFNHRQRHFTRRIDRAGACWGTATHESDPL
ncbi:hypothetical protein C8R46DRAFT_1030858 [Mycena filopes]|nr:hypothetical protein C8R46DRAFT_1030858 [Mycena filopes]